MRDNVIFEDFTVTIKTIKVNNKKMTLSVFKQLPAENIIDFNTLELKGIPWGTVNYYWGDQNPHSGIQVVWSDNNVLKRCLLKRYGEHSDYLKYGDSEYGYNPQKMYDPDYLPFGILRDAIPSAIENSVFIF
jgi:hypothetical protein